MKEILLNEALEAETYGATLQYECFTLEDKSPLNGINIKLTILSEVSKI